MCMNNRIMPRPRDIYPNYEERLELVKARDRLDTWILDEITDYDHDPKLSKTIVRRRNKLPLNM